MQKIKNFIKKDKHNKVLAAALALTIITGAAVAIDYAIPNSVKVVYASFEGSKEHSIDTHSRNVEEVVTELGYETTDQDKVTPCLEYPVEEDMEIYVTKGVDSRAVIKGQEQAFSLTPGTVRENLANNNIEYDENDIITPALDAEVTPETKIEVKDVTTKTEDKQEPVEFDVKKQEDDSMYDDEEEVITEGKNGEAIFTYTITYINGKEQPKPDKQLKEWITKPVSKEVKVGTKQRKSSLGGTAKPENGTIAGQPYNYTFTAETTAYYMGENAYGATGTRCQFGTCAVDPSVIPYGTTLYIEGYGFAVANDCGGAVKGNIVDLYMSNLDECYTWGRRWCKAYIIG